MIGIVVAVVVDEDIVIIMKNLLMHAMTRGLVQWQMVKSGHKCTRNGAWTQ